MWLLFNILIIFTSLIVLPIPRLGDIFFIPKEMMFNLLGLSFLASSLLTNIDKPIAFKNKWLGIILIYAAVSFCWFFYLPLVFNNLEGKIMWNLWNIRPTINIILAILMVKTLVEYTDTLKRWVTVAKVLCWLGFVCSSYALLQYIGIDQFYGNHYLVHPQYKDFSMFSFMGNGFLTSNFIAMISPLCLMFKDLRYKIFYLVSFVAIAFTHSAISMTAFIAGLFVYLFFMKRFRLFNLLVILAGIVALYLFKNTRFFDLSGRQWMWKDVVSGMTNFYTGNGLGSLAQNFGIKHFISAHCEPLHIIYEGGIALLVLIIGYLVGLFKRIVLKEDTILIVGFCSGLVSYLVICLAGFPLRIAPLALIGIVYISALEAQL